MPKPGSPQTMFSKFIYAMCFILSILPLHNSQASEKNYLFHAKNEKDYKKYQNFTGYLSGKFGKLVIEVRSSDERFTHLVEQIIRKISIDIIKHSGVYFNIPTLIYNKDFEKKTLLTFVLAGNFQHKNAIHSSKSAHDILSDKDLLKLIRKKTLNAITQNFPVQVYVIKKHRSVSSGYHGKSWEKVIDRRRVDLLKETVSLKRAEKNLESSQENVLWVERRLERFKNDQETERAVYYRKNLIEEKKSVAKNKLNLVQKQEEFKKIEQNFDRLKQSFHNHLYGDYLIKEIEMKIETGVNEDIQRMDILAVLLNINAESALRGGGELSINKGILSRLSLLERSAIVGKYLQAVNAKPSALELKNPTDLGNAVWRPVSKTETEIFYSTTNFKDKFLNARDISSLEKIQLPWRKDASLIRAKIKYLFRDYSIFYLQSSNGAFVLLDGKHNYFTTFNKFNAPHFDIHSVKSYLWSMTFFLHVNNSPFFILDDSRSSMLPERLKLETTNAIRKHSKKITCKKNPSEPTFSCNAIVYHSARISEINFLINSKGEVSISKEKILQMNLPDSLVIALIP